MNNKNNDMKATRKITCNVMLTFALACFAFPHRGQAQCRELCDTNDNTGEGTNALLALMTGLDNTAIGSNALFNNTGGSYNTASGALALQDNQTGSNNTASGFAALDRNTTHSYNTATGFQALLNADADDNTAIGSLALSSDTTGAANTATGFQALFSNISGYTNTAEGVNVLYSNQTGYYNTASGVSALFFNVGGHDNVADGYKALLHNKGSNNVGLGSNAGANLTTGSNNIDIGNAGVAGDSGKIRIGKVGTQNGTFIAGIHGVTVASAVGVVVDVNGHLGTVTSSARFKDEIKPMDKSSEAILALQPVTFRFKHELDPGGIPQFGLIAEEVEKVNPDLVVRDENGKVNSVRYEAVNAMLLNEFLKEHRKVEAQEQKAHEQEATIAQQKKDFEAKFAQQQKQIEALTATVQKVSDQLELNRRAPQLVANDQ
jgi:hypothetical protein